MGGVSKLPLEQSRKRLRPTKLPAFTVGALDLSPVFRGTKPSEALWATLELAPLVESFGYSRYWLAEHHGSGVAHSSPELLVPVISGLTERIRVGTAGVLLRRYSPLKVAENFRLLHALYPGRIDLGIARGGNSGNTEQASIRDSVASDFEAKVSELLRYLRDKSQDIASPLGVWPPEIWMLGSNITSMYIAARYGTAFCFAQFLARQELDPASVIATYRANFKPSLDISEPKCSIAFAGICAATDAEARALVPLNPPYTVFPTIVGGPAKFVLELQTLRARTGVTQFIFLDMCKAFEDRVNSYRLLASALF